MQLDWAAPVTDQLYATVCFVRLSRLHVHYVSRGESVANLHVMRWLDAQSTQIPEGNVRRMTTWLYS
jgi:hypothetical protein